MTVRSSERIRAYRCMAIIRKTRLKIVAWSDRFLRVSEHPKRDLESIDPRTDTPIDGSEHRGSPLSNSERPSNEVGNFTPAQLGSFRAALTNACPRGWGEKSFGPTTAVVMRAAVTDVQELVLPDAGHQLMEEQTGRDDCGRARLSGSAAPTIETARRGIRISRGGNWTATSVRRVIMQAGA